VPYVGGSLVDLFSRETTAEPTRRALRGIAADVGDSWTRLAAEHTPRRSGNLARRWESLPVERDELGYRSGTQNPSPLAHLIEFGVAPHVIEPDDEEAIETPEGPRARAEHPGHGGAFMLARSAAEIEVALPEIAQSHLSQWAAEIEQAAKRHEGIS
jgi:hypothetical protein